MRRAGRLIVYLSEMGAIHLSLPLEAKTRGDQRVWWRRDESRADRRRFVIKWDNGRYYVILPWRHYRWRLPYPLETRPGLFDKIVAICCLSQATVVEGRYRYGMARAVIVKSGRPDHFILQAESPYKQARYPHVPLHRLSRLYCDLHNRKRAGRHLLTSFRGQPVLPTMAEYLAKC